MPSTIAERRLSNIINLSEQFILDSRVKDSKLSEKKDLAQLARYEEMGSTNDNNTPRFSERMKEGLKEQHY